jgi:hypothetical protein
MIEAWGHSGGGGFGGVRRFNAVQPLSRLKHGSVVAGGAMRQDQCFDPFDYSSPVRWVNMSHRISIHRGAATRPLRNFLSVIQHKEL